MLTKTLLVALLAIFGERLLAEAAIALIESPEREPSTAGPAPRESSGPETFPTVDALPSRKTLADPFQFFGSDRRVKTRDDWKERQAEMTRLLLHYVYGPAFPPVGKSEVESRSEETLAKGKVVKHTVTLRLGPYLNHAMTVAYFLPAGAKSQSLLFNVLGKEEPKDEDGIAIAKRGYAYAAVRVGSSEKIARSIYPKIPGTRSMAWVWGMNEVLNALVSEHEFDKVVVTGCSRYGRVAALVGAMNERVDLTAPITTLAHAVHLFDDSMWGPGNAKWAGDEYGTFEGKMDRLPVDRHFIGAVIAPRAYLGIMGAEKPAFNEGHVEAYEALIPVYEWLGARENLGLYDHSPRGHGVTSDDLHTVLDFADLIFFERKPTSAKQFDQIANPDRVGFDWKAPPSLAE